MIENKFLSVAFEAIKASEEVIKKYYKNTGFVLKSDETPVTAADKEVEEVITKVIKKSFPSHGFFGEEGAKEFSKEYTWIIDPIDGTKYFIRGIPFFGTNLALMKEGKIILGIVNKPMKNELYYAFKGEGAFGGKGNKLQVSNIRSLDTSYLTIGSLYALYDSPYFEKLMDLQRNVFFSTGIRDFEGYLNVANANFDIMIENKTHIWDVAAASIIVEESGGKVTDINGSPLSLQSSTCIATNGLIHNEVIKILN